LEPEQQDANPKRYHDAWRTVVGAKYCLLYNAGLVSSHPLQRYPRSGWVWRARYRRYDAGDQMGARAESTLSWHLSWVPACGGRMGSPHSKPSWFATLSTVPLNRVDLPQVPDRPNSWQNRRTQLSSSCPRSRVLIWAERCALGCVRPCSSRILNGHVYVNSTAESVPYGSAIATVTR